MEQPKIYRYETVDSTNTVCRALAMEGAPDGTAVIARQQTAGRGRLGRRFESPPGMGLYLSMLWHPVASPEGLLPLTAMASAAAASALRRVPRAPVTIKRPHQKVRQGKALKRQKRSSPIPIYIASMIFLISGKSIVFISPS